MLMLGIAGLELGAHESRWLADPHVVGVTLFARNFSGRRQVTALIDAIRNVREDLIVAVDQEGGPVQRFRDGFTRLPALSTIGARYDADPEEAIELAELHAWLMVSELRPLGVDLSFAPVADLLRGNRAIGPRAFHADPATVGVLTQAYVRGMRLAGMAATLKHFPGHGSVAEDTHYDHAIDARSYERIVDEDLVPFRDAFQAGAEAVMMAHVCFPAVDPLPAGYSSRWIRDILRGEMGFGGLVLSDDIGMAAAQGPGGIAARIDLHLEAGCDLVLACAADLAEPALAAVAHRPPSDPELCSSLRGMVSGNWESLMSNPMHGQVAARLAALHGEMA